MALFQFTSLEDVAFFFSFHCNLFGIEFGGGISGSSNSNSPAIDLGFVSSASIRQSGSRWWCCCFVVAIKREVSTSR